LGSKEGTEIELREERGAGPASGVNVDGVSWPEGATELEDCVGEGKGAWLEGDSGAGSGVQQGANVTGVAKVASVPKKEFDLESKGGLTRAIADGKFEGTRAKATKNSEPERPVRPGNC